VRAVGGPGRVGAIPAAGEGTAAYRAAWTATLLFFGGFYALLVPLPRYLTAQGFQDGQIGLILGAFGVASLIGRPLAGLATDRYGARAVMRFGAIALTLGALAVPLTVSLPGLFGLRILQAVGYVAFTTAGTALVVALVDPAERGRRVALFGAAANVAITATPALVTLLLDVAPLGAGFLLGGLLALVSGSLTLRLPRASVTTAPFTLALPRRLWVPMLVSALLGGAFVGFFQFAPILADRRGTVSPGHLYLIYGLAIIGTRVVGGHLIDWYGAGPVVALACALMVAGHGLIATTDALAPLLLAPALIAAGGGMFHPALIAHHAALLPGAPGRATAAFYLAFDLGIGGGSWVCGLALEAAGLPGLFSIAAAMAALALPMSLGLRRPTAELPPVDR